MSILKPPVAADYARFIERSRHITAIDLRAYKPVQMERRLRSLMIRKSINGFDSYAEILKRDKVEREEFERHVTINVTQFYRDARIFATFERALVKLAEKKNGPLRAWSAGCSNGSEPYTLAMILSSIAPGLSHRIYATDIDEASLQHARSGQGYTRADIDTLPKAFLNKFMTRDPATDTFSVQPQIKTMVQFARHDLVHETYRRGFDLILCRNVVIYFSEETKKKIFAGFYASLNPGGLLFIGASEVLKELRTIGYAQLEHGLYKRPDN